MHVHARSFSKENKLETKFPQKVATWAGEALYSLGRTSSEVSQANLHFLVGP